jgi:hypothetical protein
MPLLEGALSSRTQRHKPTPGKPRPLTVEQLRSAPDDDEVLSDDDRRRLDDCETDRAAGQRTYTLAELKQDLGFER